MGNRLNKKEEKAQGSTVTMFQGKLEEDYSVTIPSTCSTYSYTLSTQKKLEEDLSSQSFTWNQMQNFCTQHQTTTEDALTPQILKATAQVFDQLNRHVTEICNDLQTGVVKMHDTIKERFIWYEMSKADPKRANQQTTNLLEPTRELILHLVTTLYVHDIILNYFRNNNKEMAKELLKQVAVSHALMKVTPEEFRMLDWFIVNYVFHQQITSEENLNSLIIYLTTVSNYITSIFENQSARVTTITKLRAEELKTTDRYTSARENYRLMKKWKKQVDSFRNQNNYVNDLLDYLALNKDRCETATIDTLTLKRNDPIINFFKHRCPKFDLTAKSSSFAPES